MSLVATKEKKNIASLFSFHSSDMKICLSMLEMKIKMKNADAGKLFEALKCKL